jgi:hypothetical protein
MKNLQRVGIGRMRIFHENQAGSRAACGSSRQIAQTARFRNRRKPSTTIDTPPIIMLIASNKVLQ